MSYWFQRSKILNRTDILGYIYCIENVWKELSNGLMDLRRKLKGENPLGTPVVEAIMQLMSWSLELEVLLGFRRLQGTRVCEASLQYFPLTWLSNTTSFGLHIQQQGFAIYPGLAWISPHNLGWSGTCDSPTPASCRLWQ